MNAPRLKSIVIENFRSLHGKVVVPLDAQVVLIHGTNGMGKTSILSAIELGLTGRVAHLSTQGELYKSYLTNLGCNEGSISIATTSPLGSGGNAAGSVKFSDRTFSAQALLGTDDCQFFSERCYLPQATLGRLLEIYDEQKTGSASPLTLFVKELLGLDPLDALVDGLDPAFHVARVRRIAPDYRHLEALKQSISNQAGALEKEIAAVTQDAERRRDDLNALLVEIAVLDGEETAAEVTTASALPLISAALMTSHEQDRRLGELGRRLTELQGLEARWKALPPGDANRDQADRERAAHAAAHAVEAWRDQDGTALESAISEVRALFADIPSLEDGPEKSRVEALRRAEVEETRCSKLLKLHGEALDRGNQLRAVEQRARSRVDEINESLSGAMRDAKALASALAGIVPHIEDEICPVCDRDFSDLHSGPLSAQVAARIATLTSEAGRLQALASERAEEARRITEAQRELLGLNGAVLSAEDLAEHTLRRARMADSCRQLRELAEVAERGTSLMASASSARNEVSMARRHSEQTNSVLPDLRELVVQITGREVSTYSGLDEAIANSFVEISSAIDSASRLADLRMKCISEISRHTHELERIRDLKSSLGDNLKRLEDTKQALKEVENDRIRAKQVSEAASAVRSGIIHQVFSTSLNRTWRDLFVRLAPSEQFVPAFRLPQDRSGQLEAVLETIHRSGKPSGSPGAMLSQGNLNTAALTLFLALHLSVEARMSWLLLDDPVRSMDDVHIAQFAALLRTLAKGLGRQVIIAIHERALFDYLTLELSPAFPGDSLITVEVSRTFEGDAVASPTVHGFVRDGAIAA